MARTDEFIPSTAADLEPDWVTRAMQQAGVLGPDTAVVDLGVSSLTEGGVGVASDIVRLTLEYDRPASAPRTVIAKFATEDERTRGMLEQFDAYGREIEFYRSLGARVPCRTPRHIGSAMDPGRAREPGPRLARLIDSLPDRVQLALTKDVTRYMRATKRRYALLIEDLGDESIVYDAVSPPPLERLPLVLSALAELHARFWGDNELGSHPAVGHLVTRTPGLYRTEATRRCLALARARWDWWTAAESDLLTGAADLLESDIATINQPSTLVHGDPRSDNVLFLSSGSVAFVDWALQAFAHPGWDVSYLLGSCVNPPDVTAIDELITGYHAMLVGHDIDISPAELESGVDAGFRVQAILEVLSVRVIDADYKDAGALHDLWAPRLMAILAHRAR